jgi:hypothetical protein
MNKVLQHSKRFLKKNASTILTCAGGVGVVATTVMAVKATPKALTLLEQAKEEKGSDLTKLETVAVAGPAYIPTVLVGVSTIACIFGANMLNKRQQAALTSAYALLDNSYKEYKKKIAELYGEEANKNVKAEIAKDKYVGDDFTSDDNNKLFYDEFSGRYFEAELADVLKAEYELNKQLTEWGGAYLNDFYEIVGLKTTDYGDHLGWSAPGLYEMYWTQWLDFEHETVTLDDGLQCTIISFMQEPIPGFEDY